MSATQIVDGVELPAAGTWSIDRGHTEVAFVGRHFGLSRIRGRFARFDGTVQIAAELAASSVDFTVETASVESGSADRDNSLRSANFFDVDNYPIARFRSTAIAVHGTRGTITGDLTIKSVTLPVEFDVEYLGSARDPWGNDRAAFTASATVDREDWGLTYDSVLDSGGILVSKQIKLEVDIELTRASTAAAA